MYGKNLTKNEENPCSTCLQLISPQYYGYPKPRFQVPVPPLICTMFYKWMMHKFLRFDIGIIYYLLGNFFGQIRMRCPSQNNHPSLIHIWFNSTECYIQAKFSLSNSGYYSKKGTSGPQVHNNHYLLLIKHYQLAKVCCMFQSFLAMTCLKITEIEKASKY